jgi:predicted dinucleotide-utilizing enzyme
LILLPTGGPAITLMIVTMGAIGSILYSHISQKEEKASMRAGVERDKERVRQMMINNRQHEDANMRIGNRKSKKNL